MLSILKAASKKRPCEGIKTLSGNLIVNCPFPRPCPSPGVHTVKTSKCTETALLLKCHGKYLYHEVLPLSDILKKLVAKLIDSVLKRCSITFQDNNNYWQKDTKGQKHWAKFWVRDIRTSLEQMAEAGNVYHGPKLPSTWEIRRLWVRLMNQAYVGGGWGWGESEDVTKWKITKVFHYLIFKMIINL